ncbi:uncharacterized protein LOC107644682 isoform X2 [Arachis ipaensis]|uniref:uncharacterized protein LOC107644682 isoform X2 n=1 Tax=Arachis ipaensis TaxID=130454 RepID=UPI000A2AF1A7|nr:uncharacterized protein LOC107644682 isoform X2 [Arachis ipaensis]
MNIDSFKRDVDELIGEFTQNESTTLADMKRVWLSKKFSYIYESSPSTNLAFFMQSLYAQCIGYMCGEIMKLRTLMVDAKTKDIKVVPSLVKRMLDRNIFLFGAVDLMADSVTETVNQLQQLQDARIKHAYEKLFHSTPIDRYVHMDLEMEVDLGKLQKMSSEYAVAKNVAIAASNILDVTNIKHLSEDKESIGDVVKKIADDWNDQKETFYKQTGCGEDEMYEQELLQQLLKDNDDDEDNEKRG